MEKMQSLFGTDGIRNKVGESPITNSDLFKLGYAFGTWATQKHSNPRILIAQDPRESSSWISSELQSGLLLHNTILANAYILPTPAIAYLLNYTTQFDYGIMISASHNPYDDNGIKFFSKETTKLSPQAELEISSYYHQALPISYTHFGTVLPFFEAHDIYAQGIISYFPEHFLTNYKIVLDCANGSLYVLAQKIFEHFGAETICINNCPQGKNINENCGATAPYMLASAVQHHKADAGFAFDGDGDRIIAVNRYGKICDGDDILALLATDPRHTASAVVGTVMSNQNLANYLQQLNKQLIRADVGDKNVGIEMKKENLPLGGEPSGHIIIRDYLQSGDGLFVALRLLETMQLTNNHDMNTFEKFPHVLINIPVHYKRDLNSEPLATIIAQGRSLVKNGRILIRYSGTESKLRIMVEDADKEHAEIIASELASKLSETLNN